MTAFASIHGRDIPFPSWARSSRSSSRSRMRSGQGSVPYDSVVVNSTGMCGLTLAGRLARSPEFQGAVKVVGRPVEETRRLVGGCTLRARTLDYFAAAMGVDRKRIESELLDSDLAPARTFRQYAALLGGEAAQGLKVVRQSCFMDAGQARSGRPDGLPLAYGIRNSRLLALLQRLALEAGSSLSSVDGAGIEESTSGDVETLRAASGSRSLLVNATPRPIPGLEVDRPPLAPRQFVAAAQVPFRASRLGQQNQIEADASFVCWLPGRQGLNMSVFYPYQDPLSPTADFYGIVYRVVDAESVRTKVELLTELASNLIAIGDLLGLDAVDPDQTMGRAVVPVSAWKGTRSSQDGVLDLSRLCGAGSPIISGDGMTRSAIGGLVGAESLLACRDPVADINTALGRYRQLNWELHLLLSRLARPASWLLARWPNLVLIRQTRSYFRDMWAGGY